MQPSYSEIDLGFSTADAEIPTIKYDEGNLEVQFIDWKEQCINVVFEETEMFSWSEIPQSFFEKPDRIYEVHDSAWLKAESTINSKYRHFVLCFNASYFYLQVLCEKDPKQQ